MRWETKKLDDVADFCLGKMLDKRKNKGVLRPYLANVNVRWGEFVFNDLREMKFEEHEHDKYGLRFGDIVMCEGGEPGRCAIWKDHRPGIMIQKALHRIRPHKTIDNHFLYYTFLHYGNVGLFSPLFTGSTIKHLPREKLAKVEVPLPPLPTQRKIASILSAYDDLIENNTRRIAILEQMAQALYREWFVHFRFPGHENVKLVDSPLGKIPEGWEVTTLGQVASINSQSIKKGNEPEQIHYIDIKSVSTGRINDTRSLPFSEAPGRARRVVRHGDTIWSTVRPNLKSYSIILDPPDDSIASTGFAVLTPNTIPFSFLYFATTTEEFATYLVNHASGSAYPAVNAKDFENAEFIVPPKPLAEQFHKLAGKMLVLAHRLLRKNENLRTTRDLLLPKLISGKLDVADLDIDMGELVEHMDKVATPSATPKLKKQPRKKGTPYKDDAAIICMLLDELEKQKRSRKEFVVQKHLFALKHHRNLKFNSEFKVMQAGPWSHDLRRKAIFAGEKQGWLWFKENTKTIEKGNKFDEALAYAEKNLSDQIVKVRRMVNELVAFTNNQLECWMTVFKVVIDLQAAETPITFSTIQHGIDNWKGKRKKRHFSVENVNKVITEMGRSDWIVLDK